MNLRPLSQVETRPILILQQMDLWIHDCKLGRHRGKVQGDNPRLGCGRSGQAVIALPSLAQLSALSHHCAQGRGATGSDQDK